MLLLSLRLIFDYSYCRLRRFSRFNLENRLVLHQPDDAINSMYFLNFYLNTGSKFK